MQRRRTRQAVLLDRFWHAIRSEPRQITAPPAGLDPEIANLTVRLAAESRSIAPTNAFRSDLRARIEAAAQAAPAQRSVMPASPGGQTRPDATVSSGQVETVVGSRRAAEWAGFIAAALAFIVVGTVLVALLRDSDDGAPLGAATEGTATPDPGLGASLPPGLPVNIELDGGRPSWGMAFGADSIWVGTVHDTDSALVRAARTGRLSGEVQATIPLPGHVWDVAYGHGSVWATVIGDSLTGEGSALVRIDPATNAIATTITLGAQPTTILIDDDAIWITDLGEPTVWRVDPATNDVAATIQLGDPDVGSGVLLTRTASDLWALVLQANGGTALIGIDPTTNTAKQPSAHFDTNLTSALVAAGDSLWAATSSNAVVRIDLESGTIVDRIEVPGLPRALLVDDGFLWLITIGHSFDESVDASDWKTTLTRIDPERGLIDAGVLMDEIVPYAFTISPDRIWLSVNDEGSRQARLRGEIRPDSVVPNPYPPTVTANPDMSPAASPTVVASSTPIETLQSTPEPTATAPTDMTPAGEITATWEFTGGLGQPAWGAGAIWVPNWTFGAVERIDAATGETSQIQVSPPGPTSNGIPMVLAADDNAIWVSDNTRYELVRIDPATSEIVARISLADLTPYPAWIESIAVGEGAAWVILDDSEAVVRIDPTTNSVTAVIDAPGARSIAVGLGGVWVQNVWTAEILRIDPATNEIVATIPTGPNNFVPMSLAVGASGVWVEDGNDQGTVLKIDPATNSIVATTAVLGIDQVGLDADDSSVWASFARANQIVRIDPSTLETRTLDITAPNGVTIGGGSVWITTATGSPNTVVQITPAP